MASHALGSNAETEELARTLVLALVDGCRERGISWQQALDVIEIVSASVVTCAALQVEPDGDSSQELVIDAIERIGRRSRLRALRALQVMAQFEATSSPGSRA